MYNNYILQSFTYIFGSNSEIARELILIKVRNGIPLCLFTTNPSKLRLFLEEYGVIENEIINIYQYDLSNKIEIGSKLKSLMNEKPISSIFTMVGYLGSKDEKNSEEEIKKIYDINYFHIKNMFEHMIDLNLLESVGNISMASSVGSDLFYRRYRDYYESKRLLDSFICDLRLKVNKNDCKVANLKIGPVYDTRMGPSKGFFKFFASAKKDVANLIYKNFNKNEMLYIPSFWKFVVKIYLSLPNRLLNFLKNLI